MKRRQFLTISAAALGGALVYSLDRQASRLSAEPQPVQIPLHFFEESEAKVIVAAVSRIFPSDELGPGAAEIGVALYIDRQLASAYGRDRYRYVQGPFDEDAPRYLGYQGKASPREVYRTALRQMIGFDMLTTVAQDHALKQLEPTRFFALLHQHTIEGMFCDPMHGGNINMLGWQMVGFPGPRDSYRSDVDQHYGNIFRPAPVSLNGSDLIEEEK